MTYYLIPEDDFQKIKELIEAVDKHRSFIGSAVIDNDIDTDEMVLTLKVIETKNKVEEVQRTTYVAV